MTRHIDNDTFLYESEDLVLKVQWDSQPASGDGWNEPRERASAWVHKLWYASKPQFEVREWARYEDGSRGSSYNIKKHTDGDGWVEMDPASLRPHVLQTLEGMCEDFAFPEEEDAA